MTKGWLLFFNLLLLLVLVGCKNKESTTVSSTTQTTSSISNTSTTIASTSQEERDPLLKRLTTMTLAEKVGQLFLARVPETGALEAIETYHLGGYLLFGREFEGKTIQEVRKEITQYQAQSPIPLLIASDEEGGSVTRISQLLNQPFESPQAIYHKDGLTGITLDTLSKVQILKDVGIVTGLFPVADITTDPTAMMFARSLGENAQITADYIAEVVSILKEEQFGSVLKHFPGYGNNTDSHTGMVYDNRTLAQLKQKDFLPFIAGIQAGADSILVSHNVITAVEEVPASLSPKINTIIRQDLDFQGVVMTDDFDMQGLSDFVSQDEGAYQAIKAGNDLILSSHYMTQIPFVLEKITTGELSEERVNEAVYRILKWKQTLGLL